MDRVLLRQRRSTASGMVSAFSLASRPVTNGEYLQFIEDDGYARAEFWLSLGWMTVNEQRWQAPLYWVKRDGALWNFTLSGFRPVDESEPVTHVSYFEADAYANWAGARLPTEFEWEHAASDCPIEGNFVENEAFHPRPAAASVQTRDLHQMYGDVWELTPQRLFALSRLSRRSRGARRIQRKVHVQPIRLARRLLRYVAHSYSPHLSQLFPA